MEIWPTDSRTPEETFYDPKRRGPRKVRHEPYWNGPLLDAGTLDSSRLLVEKYDHSEGLRWDRIGTAVEHLSAGNARCIFPSTRELANDAKVTLDRKVILTNSWLRNHKDIQDIDAAILHETMKEDEEYHRNVLDYDPYLSNLVSTSVIAKGHKKRAGVLAYPMGRRFQRLGAAVIFDEKWGTVVSPTETPVWESESPILQVTSSNSMYKPLADSYSNAGCLFAVRTLFDVDFISIRPTPGATKPTSTSHIASFRSVDIGDHRPFHVALNPDQTFDGLVVSDVGEVWTAGSELPPRMLFSPVDDSSAHIGAKDLPYWQVAWGSHPETLVLGSESAINLYDRRAPRIISSFVIHSETLTSFDTSHKGNHMNLFLCDTECVKLLDDRMFTKPLVSWRHRRTRDRTLRINTATIGSKEVGLLSSRRSQLVSVYDPVFDEGDRLTKCESYSLDFGLSSGCQFAGIATYVPFSRSKSAAVEGALFRLTDLGAIYRQDLAVGACRPSGEDEIWAHELRRLASRVPIEREEYKDSDLMDHSEISLRKIYTSLYGNESLDSYLNLGPTVADILDLAPYALQRANEPIDKIVTLHDMVRVVSQESSGSAPRTLFVSSLSTQLYTQTQEAVPWGFNLLAIQRRLAPGLEPTPNPKELAIYNTQQTTLENQDDGQLNKRIQDIQAREEISLDLALSMKVYSALAFGPSRARVPPAPVARDEDEMLSVAASALTLEESEPPHLIHIQPCPTAGLVDGKTGAEQRQSLVVRLLASEWDPDSSVDEYEFFDPYGQDYDTDMPAWRLSAQAKSDRTALQRAKAVFSTTRAGPDARSVNKPLFLPSIQISRPKPSASRPNATRLKKEASRVGEGLPEPLPTHIMSSQPRQPEFSQTSQPAEDSQIPSTQVLSGPFGGRPGVTAPRKKKTRLAGF